MERELEPRFGKLRSCFWPIYSHESYKVIPMLLMAFCIGFVYATLRTMKDGLIVTADQSGAEVIPFIKLWAILPMALLLTTVFIRLSHRISLERLFYVMTSLFLGFFAVFTFVLYPMRDLIHPHELAEWATQHLPRGFSGPIAMCRYWSYTLFYAMAELWGTIVLNVLFWGFANEVTKVHEASRFYVLLGFGYNLATIVSGQVSYRFCQCVFNPAVPYGTTAAEQCILYLTLSVIACGLITMAIFRWLNRHVVPLTAAAGTAIERKAEKIQHRGRLRDDIKTLAKSKYVLQIAIIVVSYNLLINLVEIVWKDQVRALYPEQTSFTAYMSQVTTLTGIIATLMVFFASGHLIRRFGWTVGAMVTPMILAVTSIGFFGILLLPNQLALSLTSLLGTTPLAIAVFFGSTQNILSRASKYTLFDCTKDLAFIPLERDLRVRSKAAIDGVGSRFGKSGGSLIHQSLYLALHSVAAGIPVVAGILVVVLSGWMVTVRSLGRKFVGLATVTSAPPRDHTPTFEPNGDLSPTPQKQAV
jgi:ATP:ADP antiporter, AAA family